ncbi:MAG TPA: DUF4912 domain-containing protein [Candidatus Methylacidiphilales bacterium]|nr:DUF4912 domain-containing protein [Candidatus Methylacidiphilales bacterium]
MSSKITIPPRKSSPKRSPVKVAARGGAVKPPAPEPNPADPVLAPEPANLDIADRKFVLTPPPKPTPSEPPAYEYLGELPDAYGSKKLYLVSRDPYFLFAYWDLTWQQFQEASRASHDGKVFLEIYHPGGHRVQQIQIHESAKNWYIQVNQPATKFFAQLGFYRYDGSFEVISRSGEIETPRDSFSPRSEAQFVTIPPFKSFKEIKELVQTQYALNFLPPEEILSTLLKLQTEGVPMPFPVSEGTVLTEQQQTALLDYIGGGDIIRQVRVGSLDITEVLRRRLLEQMSSGQWGAAAPGVAPIPPGQLPAFSWPTSGQWVSSVSSPFGASFGAQKDRGFYMHVNAELIIYGGTDPKARVKIDGKHIKLREDGTFSYHFVFPDGQYFIPIEATSPDEVETRSALLSFLRVSDYEGDVKKTGQPPLPPPIGEVKSDV